MAAHPNVTINEHGPRERGAQDEDRDRDAGRHLTGRLPVVGRRRPRRAGRGRPRQGHHRRRRAVGRHHEPRRPWASTRSTASSTASRTTSGWSASGTTRPSSRRPGSRRRRPRGTSSSTAVGKLKDAGITPIALGGKDKWPGMFWWAYLSIRQGGQAALDPAVNDRRLGRAGLRRCRHRSSRSSSTWSRSRRASSRRPTRTQSAAMGNGKAAMELMGQWAPGAQAGESASKKGIGEDLAWFPFPTLDRRRRRRRPTRSAAPTAGPSARTRPPRRSTS